MIYKYFYQRLTYKSVCRIDDYRQRVARICHNPGFRVPLILACMISLCLFPPDTVKAHGGVVMEEDQCVIDIGLFRAHFTIYQPETSASEEFCEDVPDLGATIFVMDYLHDSLRQMPVDFRIIRDVNNKQGYAAWEDIESIADLDEVTVYYQPAGIEPSGSLSTQFDFDEEGWYIGIVTTRQSGSDKIYRAVFGFHVGGQGTGYWPLLILVALLVQIQYWVSSGGWKRWQAGRAKHSIQGNSV